MEAIVFAMAIVMAAMIAAIIMLARCVSEIDRNQRKHIAASKQMASNLSGLAMSVQFILRNQP